jgi:hypothetical protein
LDSPSIAHCNTQFTPLGETRPRGRLSPFSVSVGNDRIVCCATPAPCRAWVG